MGRNRTTIGLSVWLSLAAAGAEADAIGPSFDCGSAQDPLAQVICSDQALSRLDLQFAQAYQALRGQSGEAGAEALRREAVDFHNSVLQRCGISAAEPKSPQTARCVHEAYQDQRSRWLAHLTGAAAEEANRPIDHHVDMQAILQQVGFLAADASLDGVYGPATRAAIAGWQRSRGVTATGLLGDVDARALVESPDDTTPDTRAIATPRPAPLSPTSAQGSMTFDWAGNGGTCIRCWGWIRADGIITDNTPADFEAFVKDVDHPAIVLNSPGGNLNAAMELGRAFRDRHASTEIADSVLQSNMLPDRLYSLKPGICLSACFFAFVGGERRSLIANHADEEVNHNRLGIHRFSEADPNLSLTAAQTMAGAEAAYLSEMGIDTRILAIAASVEDVRDLTPAEAATYHIITENLPITGNAPAPRWTIDRAGTGLSPNLRGNAQNEESLEQFDYAISLSCYGQGQNAAAMSVRLRPPGGRVVGNLLLAFDHCHGQAIGFEWQVQDRRYGTMLGIAHSGMTIAPMVWKVFPLSATWTSRYAAALA